MSLLPLTGSKKESDAFAEEAVGHLDALYSVACKLTRNPSEAEDLVQDTLLKAMRARSPKSRRSSSSTSLAPSSTCAISSISTSFSRSR
jgi:DNA-directed RNA polymerase specialized sigma24 family protein